MKVDFRLNNLFVKKQQKKNYIAPNNANTTNPIVNKYEANLLPMMYYIKSPSFRGDLAQTSKEDKTSFQIEEEKLNNLLVKPILEDKPLPSAILLYSEDAQKSSALIGKVTQKANIKVVNIDTEQNDFSYNLFNTLKEARKNYIDNKQRTVVVIKDSELFLSEAKSNYAATSITKTLIEDCSQIPSDDLQNAYATTLIFETSNPQGISDKILKNKNLSGFINISVSNTKEIERIIISFIDNEGYKKGLEQIDNKKIKELSRQMSPNVKLGGYSDNRIISILNKALNEWESQNTLEFDKILSKKIQTTRRDIPSRIIANSFESRRWLIENGWMEAPEFGNADATVIEEILSGSEIKTKENNAQNELSQILSENNVFIANAESYDAQEIKSATIKKKPLVELWLNITNNSLVNKENTRLKNLWFDEVLSDENKTRELVSKTITILKEENAAINFAKTAYADILENDDTLSEREREILLSQQESLAFFNTLASDVKSNKLVILEDKILSALKTLSKEENRVSANANENIFEPARNVMLLSSDNSDDASIVDYIFQLLSQYALNGSDKEKETIKEIIEEFNLAKNTGDIETLDFNWQKMVNCAQEYFNKVTLNDLTNRNIALLNSITKEKENIQDKKILKLLDDNSLTIEQREFIARYAKDSNFRLMLKNQNVDIASIVEELVFFEANNIGVIEQAGLLLNEFEFNKIMSDKFKEINRAAKDINIQGDKIASKLDNIGEIINNQNDIISNFANSFAQYSSASLSIQFAQLNELTKIGQNTDEIRRYTQTLTRAKLLELEKNKYYAEIVPDLIKLLPENEQIDIGDFLSKVDELAKKEKNDLKKKKIIKTAVIIAGVAAAGVATYYFGPAIIAHLFSQVKTPAIAAGVITKTATNTQLARKMGTSAVLFGNSAGWPREWYSIENQLKSFPARDAYRAIEAVKRAKGSGGISIDEIKKILSDYGFKIVSGTVVRK